MRLRKRSGTVLWSMVLRSTAEITSAHPATASRTRPTQSTSTSPKSAMAAPQTQTATITAQPWRRRWVDPPGRQRADEGARAGRGVEEPEGDRAAAEDRAGHGREQRPRHAEHHGVDVDQVDTLERLAGAQVAQPLPGRLPQGEASRPLRGRDGRQQGGGDEGDDEGGRVERVDQRQPDGEQDSREGGSDDGAHLDDDLHQGERGGEVAPFDHAGHRRHAGRAGEAHEAGGQRAHDVEHGQRRVRRGRVDRHGGAGERHGGRRPDHDAAPVDRVADRPGRQ